MIVFVLIKKNSVTLAHQEMVFRAQLKIANETGLPIVIHCRNTETKCLEILSEVS